MVRTHIQLRDVQTELGLSRVGSDVVMDQIAHLERGLYDPKAMVGGRTGGCLTQKL